MTVVKGVDCGVKEQSVAKIEGLNNADLYSWYCWSMFSRVVE